MHFPLLVWEQRKLGEVLLVNSGKDYKNLNKGNIPVYGTGGYMLSVNRALSNENAIGIGRKGTIDRPQYLIAPFWTVDTLFFLTVKNQNDLKFFYALFQKINWKKYDESTGLPSLSKSTLNNIFLKNPNYKEQKKIGLLLSQIEVLITLQQRKLKLVYQLKKTLLEQLISEKGEPIVRFNSFRKEWERFRLENFITKTIKGKAKAEMVGNRSIYLDTSYLNGGTPSTVDAPTDVYIDDTIILWDGSLAGKVYHGFSGALGSTLKSFTPKYSGEYLFQYLQKSQEKIFKNYRTPNIPHVIKDFTTVFRINAPSLEEQNKISAIFELIDRFTSNQSITINKLKKIKRSLLQKLFI